MNLAKHAFEVFNFLVHHQGIQVDKNKAKVILEARPPKNKKVLQSLISKINFLRIFIANLVGQMKALSPLLRLNNSKKNGLG